MFLPKGNGTAAGSRLPRNSSFSETDWEILASFWHPVALSDAVAAAPVRVELLDVEVVVWRTSAGVHAAKDVCMHRGGQLSRGTLRGDLLVCPLHGFHYDGSGACRKIPALASGAPIPSRLKLQTYNCVERYGLVWVCLAETPRLPLPEWPDLEAGVGTTALVPPGIWHASAARHVENFNDLAHIPFVHQGTFGGEEDRSIAPYDVAVDGLSLSFQADYHEQVRYAERPAAGSLPLRHRRYSYRLTLPFTCTLQLHDVAENTVFKVYDIASPESAMRSRIFQILHDETGKMTREAMIEFQTRINAEDAPLVEAQSPMELPLNLRDEVHIPADRMSIEYRRVLAGLGLGAEVILGDRASADH
jgi:vanillate O-demethylase monooxygenase subunit